MEIKSLVKPTKTNVVYVRGAFDKSKEYLEANEYNIASAEDIAKARIEQGKDTDVSRYGGWTKEGFLYVPQDREVRLTKNSPIIASAKEATNCHRNGKEFCLTKEQLDQSLEGSVKFPKESIPTNRFGKNEVTLYLFGETAQEYGEFLREAGIKQMPVYLATHIGEKPFARQLLFGSLGGGSELAGDGRRLRYDGYGAFGVRASADEGSLSAPGKGAERV